MSAAESLEHLRARLERRFGGAILPAPGQEAPREERPGFRTGVAVLDRLLPGGVPRRALTLWTGEGTAGRTAAVRALVHRACARGARVALVDAGRTLDPAAWCAGDRSPPGLWVARPPAGAGDVAGAWAAEALLRSAAFDLVVLDGPPPAAEAAHRLRALARETGAALLVSTGSGTAGWRADAALAFRRAGAGSGLRTGGRFRRLAAVRMAKGWGARTGEGEVELVHEPTHRLHPGPRVADRRPRQRG